MNPNLGSGPNRNQTQFQIVATIPELLLTLKATQQ
jgi:hypothetical protein